MSIRHMDAYSNSEKALEFSEVPFMEKERSKCIGCKIKCEFAGKSSYPREVLEKAPKECSYREEIGKATALLDSYSNTQSAILDDFTPTISQISSQEQIKAIGEIGKYYEQ